MERQQAKISCGINGSEGELVINWVWKLCNTEFERDVVSENWRTIVTVPLYKGNGERIVSKLQGY